MDGLKGIRWRNIAFPANGAGKVTPHLKMQKEANTNRKACTHDFRSFTKVNRYSIDLNVRYETEQPLAGGMRGNLGDCPNFISVTVIKYPNKQQSRGERICFASQSIPSSHRRCRDVKATRNLKQGLPLHPQSTAERKRRLFRAQPLLSST